MTVRIEMPQLSAGGADEAEGEGAVLAAWLVKSGDRVEAGEIIAELETDKSTIELEAPTAGIVLELAVAAGTEGVVPGTLLARIQPDTLEGAQRETTASAAVPASDPGLAARTSSSFVSADTEPAAMAVDPRSSTPLARRTAAHRGLDLQAVEGSGAGGRIVQADVLRVAEEGNAPGSRSGVLAEERDSVTSRLAVTSSGSNADGSVSLARAEEGSGDGFEAVRLSAMRKTIARRMTESKQQVPHFYLSLRCSMDAIAAIRVKLNDELASAGRETKISVNDFVVKAAALALREVPAANVRFAEDALHIYDHVDIAVAVATDGGLVTPVVRDADRKGLIALAEEIKSLAARARAGSLRPEEYQAGTFTISNLGMYGIDTVYPILNPPQACILGVGAAEEQAVVRDGEIGIGRIASITLAADHRAVDGAVGAKLLAAIRSRLEDPLAMML